MSTSKKLIDEDIEIQYRLSEIAQLLEQGLLRHRNKPITSEKKPLAISANQSVHGQPINKRKEP